MTIEHLTNGNGGYFEALIDGYQAGLMSYSNASGTEIIIEHTAVDFDYGGQGIGTRMVMAAVDWARGHGKKIIPLCPFARNVLAEDSSVRDVVAHGSLVP